MSYELANGCVNMILYKYLNGLLILIFGLLLLQLFDPSVRIYVRPPDKTVVINR